MASEPSKNLETFPNPNPGSDYEIRFHIPEFTCLCPKTGQPDFAEFHIRYIPHELCVELKSLKLYFWAFRNEGAFHEAITNEITQKLSEALHPRALEVKGVFNVRGGIYTTVVCHHGDMQKLASRAQEASTN